MNKRVTIQFADFIKSRLAGGLLCCLVLLAAYLFQMFSQECMLMHSRHLLSFCVVDSLCGRTPMDTS